jgi:hypothetical protein
MSTQHKHNGRTVKPTPAVDFDYAAIDAALGWSEPRTVKVTPARLLVRNSRKVKQCN